MSTESVVREVEQLLPHLDPAFERGAVILHTGSEYLTSAFRNYVFSVVDDNVIACYSSIMDIQSRPCRPYDSLPTGRFFATFMRASAHDVNLTLAAAIHEGAHYLTDRNPARDEPDQKKAPALWWQYRDPHAGSHDRDWLKCVVSLWHRACRFGYEVPLSTFMLDQYDYGAKDWGPLLDEASDHEATPLESLVRRKAKATSTPTQEAPEGRKSLVGRESIAGRMRRHGLPQSLTAWAGGKLFEIRNGEARLDGKRISLERAARIYAKWDKAVGPAYGRAPAPQR